MAKSEDEGLDGLYFQKDMIIDKIICELVDNSIDHPKGESVDVYVIVEKEILDTEGTESDSFRIYVYDNGIGLIDENTIHKAFRLSTLDMVDSKRIGKFHWGMKTAPLYRFNHFSLISRTKDGYVSRSTRYPGVPSTGDNYLWREDGIEKSRKRPNPSDNVPIHVGEKNIINTIEKHELTTCAVMTSPRMSLIQGLKKDQLYFDAFLIRLQIYLGIVYQHHIEEKKSRIFIGKSIDDAKLVLPVDPFLSDYSPNGMLSLSKIEVKTENKLMLETIAPYGTLVGERRKIAIKIPNEDQYPSKDDQFLHITPFFVPSASIVDLLTSKYEHQDLKGRKIIPSQSSSSWLTKNKNLKEICPDFTGKGLQGFYFYRGNRAIIFGSSEGSSTNLGFYKGIKGFSQIGGTGWANLVRVKVEYDPSPELDLMFKLAGNKDSFDGNPHSNIWTAIKKGIQQMIDGEDEKHAPPLNKALPFWVENSDHHIGSLNQYPPKKCEVCGWRHPKGKCPKGICVICEFPKKDNNCTVTTCNTVCKECTKPGHIQEKCPKLKCTTCNGFRGYTCTCCPTCGPSCTCDAKVCCPNPCSCPKPPTPKPGKKGKLYQIKEHGDLCVVRFDPSDSIECLEMVRKILDKIGKSKSDL